MKKSGRKVKGKRERNGRKVMIYQFEVVHLSVYSRAISLE
jgi:hypothetical protein